MPTPEVPPGTPPEQQPAGGATTAPASNPGSTPGGGNAAPQKPSAGSADVVTFPRSSMRRFKQEEREAGQRALAKELGYESIDAMKAAVAASKKQPPAAKPKPGAAQVQAPAQQRDPALERELAELKRLNKLNSQRFAEFKQEAYAAQADAALQQEAQAAGCTEPKLALYLLKDKLAEVSQNARRMGKDRDDRKRREQKALAEFDRAKFYAELQKERPYLFGAKQAPPTPANTGTGNSTNGNPPPKPGSGPQNGAAFNALEAKSDDVRKFAGKLGIKWPA